ncbi:hypothetical protein, partial [Paracoccus sp. SCN 68-21]|uniref:hypothetical protein n=1 Tax=Paracoccus sp. SCN 68-21 TaxID=1660154 RepID=UPI00257BFD68
MMPRAMTGQARAGSATPSSGENTPPRHARPVAWPCSVAWALAMLRKSAPSMTAPFPAILQRTASISALPRAEK